MEELQLLEKVERYLRGEMNEQEMLDFEADRKVKPELDQLVVEHSMFYQQLDQFAEWKNFKTSLHETHAHLTESGAIREEAPRALVIELWRKYKRVMAVAASIAGVTTMLIAGIATYYNRQANRKDLEELSRIFKREVDQKKNDILREVDRKMTKVPANAMLKSGGTGFLIDNKGYLITNAHVVKGSNSVLVQNNKGDQFRTRIAYIDENTDLAVLKIEDADFKVNNTPPYTITRSQSDLGESLFTLGYPRDEIVYNEGYMSAKTGYNGDTLTCQIGVSANPGNSGGPVFNKNGEVIGIITTRQSQAENVVFAITSKNILRQLEEIKRTDSTIKSFRIPSHSSLKGMERTQQIKKIEDFVFMVKSY